MDRSQSKPLSPAAFFGIIAAAIALIGGIGYYAIAPRGPVAKQPPPGGTPVAENPLNKWIKEKYAETGGDWNKLSQEDQGRLMQSARGNGKAMFETIGKSQ